MGERLYQAPPPGIPHQAAFHLSIRKLLDRPLSRDDQGRLTPTVLTLSPDAFSVWRKYHDATERQLTPLGDYTTVCDFAAKSAENAARIAGCFHDLENDVQGAISEKTMLGAVKLARWYLRETLRVLDVLEEPQARSDARLLDGWLQAKFVDVPVGDVLRLGPASLRNKARRDAAINVLTELGRVRIKHRDKAAILERNPVLRLNSFAKRAKVAKDALEEVGSFAEFAPFAFADTQNHEIERGEL